MPRRPGRRVVRDGPERSSPRSVHAYDLRRGDRLNLGAPSRGLRAWLAVAGGFAVAPMLGSVSTHTRTRLGGLDGTPSRRAICCRSERLSPWEDP